MKLQLTCLPVNQQLSIARYQVSFMLIFWVITKSVQCLKINKDQMLKLIQVETGWLSVCAVIWSTQSLKLFTQLHVCSYFWLLIQAFCQVGDKVFFLTGQIMVSRVLCANTQLTESDFCFKRIFCFFFVCCEIPELSCKNFLSMPLIFDRAGAL